MNTAKNAPPAAEVAAAAAPSAPQLTPEQEAQIEESARQLTTATPIPGVTTEMLDAGKGMLDAGLDTLGGVADAMAVVGTVVEAAVGVVSIVADVVGSLDLGG
jgi:hypothetical protein